MHIKQVSLFKKGYMITNEATLKLRWKKALREKCPYLELFWSSFFRIWTQYEEVRLISPYSVRIQENTDQKNSEYGHLSRSEALLIKKACISVTGSQHRGRVSDMLTH